MKKMMVWLAESFAPKCKKAFENLGLMLSPAR